LAAMEGGGGGESQGAESRGASPQWLPARVLARRRHNGGQQVKLRYTGYGSDTEEWVDVESPRLRLVNDLGRRLEGGAEPDSLSRSPDSPLPDSPSPDLPEQSWGERGSERAPLLPQSTAQARAAQQPTAASTAGEVEAEAAGGGEGRPAVGGAEDGEAGLAEQVESLSQQLTGAQAVIAEREAECQALKRQLASLGVLPA